MYINFISNTPNILDIESNINIQIKKEYGDLIFSCKKQKKTLFRKFVRFCLSSDLVNATNVLHALCLFFFVCFCFVCKMEGNESC